MVGGGSERIEMVECSCSTTIYNAVWSSHLFLGVESNRTHKFPSKTILIMNLQIIKNNNIKINNK